MTKFFLSLLFCLISFQALSAELPAEFQYKGKPIDPYCFEALVHSSGEVIEVNLDECTNSKDIQREKLEKNPDGTIGYDYKSPDESGELNNRSYIYYEPIGKLTNAKYAYFKTWAVYTVHSGGGTGIFSNIRLVERHGDKISSRGSLTSGDRCNGGVAHYEEKDGKIIYSVNLTPADLFMLVNGDSDDYGQEYGLNFSANNCVAYGNFENKKLVSVELNTQNYEKNNEPSCFDKVYDSYIQKKQTKLDRKQMVVFSEEIKTKCSK